MKKRIIFISIVSAMILSMAVACSSKDKTGPDNGGGATTQTNYLFRDDFNGPEINKKLWTLCYTENPPATWNRFFKDTEGWENVRIENGNLVLKANHHKGDTFKTGGVYTAGYRYGVGTRLTVKAKLVDPAKPDSKDFNVKGAFPAIWYYPLGTKNPWPADGEIDLMEWITSDPRRAWLTIQCLRKDGSARSETANIKGVNTDINMGEYHTYTCDIVKDKVILYIDGKKALEFTTTNPPDQKWYPYNDVASYIILNASYQNGSWGPGPDKNSSANYEMWVDYVEVTKLDPNNPNPEPPKVN